jgi:hypothetical protein
LIVSPFVRGSHAAASFICTGFATVLKLKGASIRSLTHVESCMLLRHTREEGTRAG